MRKLFFPWPPISASIKGALVASSVLIFSLRAHDLHLWWLEIWQSFDQLTGWTEFTSLNDSIYLYQNSGYGAFVKVNSYLILAFVLFVITTIGSWIISLIQSGIFKKLRAIHDMVNATGKHHLDLSRRIPELSLQADCILKTIGDISANLTDVQAALDRATTVVPTHSTLSKSSGLDASTHKQESSHQKMPTRSTKKKDYDIELEL